jgi:hypothetical protein
MLAFGVELLIILRARQTRQPRPLFFLPLLFLLWSNLDGQFLLGLLLLVFFLLGEAVDRLAPATAVHSQGSSWLPLLSAAGLSLLAVLLNPYAFRLFSAAFQSSYDGVMFTFYSEMTAQSFRRPEHFVVLLLMIGAFFALGRRHSRDLFKIAALSCFALLSFRVQRDSWCVVFLTVAILGDALPEPAPTEEKAQRWQLPALLVLVLVVFLAAAARLPDNSSLARNVDAAFPKKACDVIRNSRLPGPLLNSFSYGGFVTWYLPEYPVAIDGRLNLYGGQMYEDFFDTYSGKKRLEDNPVFTGANTFLIERDSPLARAAHNVPALRARFNVVYEDNQAAVLVRK